MIKFSALFSALLLSFSLSAQYRCQDTHQTALSLQTPSIDYSARSDTFNIHHIALKLDFSALPLPYLTAEATLTISPLQPHSGQLTLDLLLLQVDSVKQNGQTLSWQHNDTLLMVDLLPGSPVGQSFDLTVYYQGSPPGDGSGWGGWHQKNGYYFNLGVGFAANPHPYGRAWHPCFDNFVERQTYEFEIHTRAPLRAYANGLRSALVSAGGDSLISYWTLSDSIPSYLASVAISDYIEVEDTFALQQGAMPVMLMAKVQDSSALLQSFSRLEPISQALEAAFGPYRWQKIGYAATTTGAMEHATSIHMPVNLIRNNSGEDIIAHELAHHWWGNLLTCETDADMWINEGLAEYSSHLYLDQVESHAAYLEAVRANQYYVLSNAHLRDDAYRPIYGLDHEYVYGAHVYQKGAMVGHNLRHYLGDSSFAASLSTLLNDNAFGNLNTFSFRDQLATISGENLQHFWDEQILNKGFASFAIDSLASVAQGNLFEVSVVIRQRLHHAPQLFSQVPLKISFFGANGEEIDRELTHSGSKSVHQVGGLSFAPKYAVLNYEGGLLSADTYDLHSIGQNGVYPRRYTGMEIQASQFTDTARVIVVQHWSGATESQQAGLRPSGKRYFSLKGDWHSKVVLKANIPVKGAAGEWEDDLLQRGSDSLMVLYRPHAYDAWQRWPYQNVNVFGPAGNQQGWISLDSLAAGDYTLANAANDIHLPEHGSGGPAIKMFPNPTDDSIRLEFIAKKASERVLRIFTLNGQEVKQMTIDATLNEIIIPIQSKEKSLVIQVDDWSKVLVIK